MLRHVLIVAAALRRARGCDARAFEFRSCHQARPWPPWKSLFVLDIALPPHNPLWPQAPGEALPTVALRAGRDLITFQGRASWLWEFQLLPAEPSDIFNALLQMKTYDIAAVLFARPSQQQCRCIVGL